MKNLPSRPELSRSVRDTIAAGLTALLIAAIATSGFTGCIQDTAPSSPDRTASFLVELLHDAQVETRHTAIESIGKLGDPSAVTALLPFVTNQVPLLREAAVKAIGRLHPPATPEIAAACIAALADPLEPVRRAAVIALGEIEPSAAMMAKVLLLLSSPDIGVRRAAAQALVQIDSTSWISQLASALQDADPDVRQSLIAALGEWGGLSAGSWLKGQLARDPSPAVRIETVYRLGKIGGSEAIAALDALLEKESDRDVERWARRTREELRSL